MVKHVILWKIKEDKTEEEKKIIRQKVKEGLEGLKGQIPGLVEISVQTEFLASSTADLMLDSLFESEAALRGMQDIRHMLQLQILQCVQIWKCVCVWTMNVRKEAIKY